MKKPAINPTENGQPKLKDETLIAILRLQKRQAQIAAQSHQLVVQLQKLATEDQQVRAQLAEAITKATKTAGTDYRLDQETLEFKRVTNGQPSV